jgi:hypothetical protein
MEMGYTRETHRYIIETPRAGLVLLYAKYSACQEQATTENITARLITGLTESYKDGNEADTFR